MHGIIKHVMKSEEKVAPMIESRPPDIDCQKWAHIAITLNAEKAMVTLFALNAFLNVFG